MPPVVKEPLIGNRETEKASTVNGQRKRPLIVNRKVKTRSLRYGRDDNKGNGVNSKRSTVNGVDQRLVILSVAKNPGCVVF